MNEAAREPYREAIAHDRAGQLDVAIPLFEQASRRDPECGLIWAMLGHAYERVGRPQDALHAAQRAVECSPRSKLASQQLVHLLIDNGRPEESVAELERYLGVKPDEAHDVFFEEVFEAMVEQGGPVPEERSFVDAMIEVAREYRAEELGQHLRQLDYPYSESDGGDATDP